MTTNAANIPSMADNDRMARVVVIGAGVIGCSIAWHLASRGCKDVVVIDRGSEPGSGSTPRATGGFRCQFNTAVNIRLSLLSREKLRRVCGEGGSGSRHSPPRHLFLPRRGGAVRPPRQG